MFFLQWQHRFRLNLLPAGDIDRLSAHGGCPVLVGSKWITNKWVAAFDQVPILRISVSAVNLEFLKHGQKF
jgi:hypothetical protein